LTIKKLISIISSTILIPISSFGVMFLPFVYFLEKIAFYACSILLIIFLLNKTKWLETKTIIKTVYFIIIYALGGFCVLAYFSVNMFEGRQLRERNIYLSGIYTAEEIRSWDNEVEVTLIRYNLSGSQKGDFVFYKNADCNFQIKKNNEDIFLESACDKNSSTVIKERIKFNN
jgi:hypothetical protein